MRAAVSSVSLAATHSAPRCMISFALLIRRTS
jgi:hypothetical protein